MGFGATVGSFGDVAQIITKHVDDVKAEAVKAVFDELVTPGVTPRDTGTLVWSWRAGPVTTGMQWPPEIKQYEGWPAPFDKTHYVRHWTTFYVYNNQPYLNKVNDMPKYMEFIQAAVKRATDRMVGYKSHA